MSESNCNTNMKKRVATSIPKFNEAQSAAPQSSPKSSHKPRFRGVSHKWAAVAAAIAGTCLVYASPSSRAAIGTSVYTFSLVNLFGTSAIYHIPTWDPVPRQFMRRLDHSAIFGLIAGTYTPLVMLIFSNERANNPTSEQANEPTIQLANKRTSERANERTSKRAKERTSKLANTQANE